MMKSFIKPMTLAAVLGTGCALASDSDVDARLRQMEQLIEQQQQQLQQQKQEMNDMRGAMQGQQYLTQEEATRLIQNEMTVMVDQRVEQGMAQMRDSSPILTLGKNIDGLDIRGDLRLRFERSEVDEGPDDSDEGEHTRDRWRVRLRVGGVWKSEGWEVGLGLATGGSDATSTNQTYNEDGVFATNNIRLDYAYAKHTWGDLSITAGQFKNPFEGSYIMWDGDVRPTGVVAQYGYQGFFLTVGGFNSIHNGTDEAEGYLIAGQVGYAGSYDQLDYLVATSFYHFNKSAIDDNGQSLVDISDYDFAFEIWDVYGELTYKMNDVKIGLHGHFLKNFGADSVAKGSSVQVKDVPGDYEVGDNDIAWMLGGSVSYQGVTLGYDYAHIEGDSAYNAVNDGDFGAATGLSSSDVKGHKLTAKYKVNDNLSFQATAFFVSPIEREESAYDNGQLYQLDAVWKF